MSNLNKIKLELYKTTRKQKYDAWNIKNYKKSSELRKKEQINYEKYKLLEGIIKANEKGNKNDKR